MYLHCTGFVAGPSWRQDGGRVLTKDELPSGRDTIRFTAQVICEMLHLHSRPRLQERQCEVPYLLRLGMPVLESTGSLLELAKVASNQESLCCRLYAHSGRESAKNRLHQHRIGALPALWSSSAAEVRSILQAMSSALSSPCRIKLQAHAVLY